MRMVLPSGVDATSYVQISGYHRTVMEENEQEEEEEQEEEDEQDNLFEVLSGAESDSDGSEEGDYLEDDDMSEDGLGLGPTPQEEETVVVSSVEDEARRQQKRAKRSRSFQVEVRCLDFF